MNDEQTSEKVREFHNKRVKMKMLHVAHFDWWKSLTSLSVIMLWAHPAQAASPSWTSEPTCWGSQSLLSPPPPLSSSANTYTKAHLIKAFDLLTGAQKRHVNNKYFIIAVPGNFHHHCHLILMLVTAPLLRHSVLHPPPVPALAKTHTVNGRQTQHTHTGDDRQTKESGCTVTTVWMLVVNHPNTTVAYFICVLMSHNTMSQGFSDVRVTVRQNNCWTCFNLLKTFCLPARMPIISSDWLAE